MKIRVAGWIAAAIFAGAAGLWYASGTPPAREAAVSVQQKEIPPLPAPALRRAEDARPPAPAQESAVPSPLFMAINPVSTPSPADTDLRDRLREQYERAEDLHPLVQRLDTLSIQGVAEASRLLQGIYEECWIYNLNPEGFIPGLRIMSETNPAHGPAHAAAMMAAGERVVRRCRGLFGLRMGPREIAEMTVRAARQGDLASQISYLLSQRFYVAHYAQDLVMEGDDISAPGPGPEQVAELARRARTSQDPPVYLMVASTMTTEGLQEPLPPPPQDLLLAQAAWTIAACRLGQDCGPAGTLATRLCRIGLGCGFTSVEDFYVQALPPALHGQLWREVDRLTRGKSEQ